MGGIFDFIGNLFGNGGNSGGLGSGFLDFAKNNPAMPLGDFMKTDLATQFTNQGQDSGGGIFGNLGPLLQGTAAVGGYFNDKDQQAMMKDLMQKQMQMQMSEIGRQKQAYNTQLADRQHGRVNAVDAEGNHVTPAWHLPVDEYMNQHRMA